MYRFVAIQIFHTPEGVLSIEKGIYIAESSAVKSVKHAKGQNDLDNSKPNHAGQRESARRDPSAVGKDIGKGAKKTDKNKTAKEEARELLKEESTIREKVRYIEKNLSLMLQVIGELAISNTVFSHSKLPSLVTIVNPLLRSAIVGDEAYKAMLKLASCLAPPLSKWAPEIATALRIISTEEILVVWELAPLAAEREPSGKSSIGTFERIILGLSVSCKSGPLPVDSFVFVCPILEQILLSAKKTKLHDDVIRILSLHLDPALPLPRLRMLSVLYPVLGIVPGYQASIGPMLNELCLGLQVDELSPALQGVYAKYVHVRLACLKPVKCIPSVSGRSLPQNAEDATSIYIALHDSEKETLSRLFSLYIRDVASGRDILDSHWLGRLGIALALHSLADVLRAKDLTVVMTFLISRALADPNADVRGRMVNAGIMIIDKHGKDNVSLLFPVFENDLNKKAPDEEKYDLVREGVVIFTGTLRNI